MDGDLIVGIPVRSQAADLVSDHARATGRLVSEMSRPSDRDHDPRVPLLADLKRHARADGLSDAEIDHAANASRPDSAG